MLYINLDWDWLVITSNSCKYSCKFYKNSQSIETFYMWLPWQKSGSRILNLRQPLWLSWLETFHIHCNGIVD